MEKLLQRLDINNLIKSANDGAYCGTECQKKKKETQLRENVNKAALNIKNAPDEYEKAQAEYIRFLHGDEKYEEYEHKIDVKKFMKEIKTPLNSITTNMGELKEIDRNNQYLNKTIQILENNVIDETEKVKEARAQLDTLKLKVDTTRQKTKYENDNQLFLNNIYKYNNFIFYVLFVLSIIAYYSKFGMPSFKMSVVFVLVFLYSFVVDYFTISTMF